MTLHPDVASAQHLAAGEMDHEASCSMNLGESLNLLVVFGQPFESLFRGDAKSTLDRRPGSRGEEDAKDRR